MKKIIFIGVGIIAIALLVLGCATTPQQAPAQQSFPTEEEKPSMTNEEVMIKDFRFTPA